MKINERFEAQTVRVEADMVAFTYGVAKILSDELGLTMGELLSVGIDMVANKYAAEGKVIELKKAGHVVAMTTKGAS